MTTLKGHSAFSELGMPKTIELLKEEIRELYLADNVPWIIGYSGGKDSSAVLQLTWLAIAELPPERRQKTIHVISTDTLVENPIVAGWVTRALKVMKESAASKQMPFSPHRLTPSVQNSFWVNLIGKGYPAPRFKFRWCTERLKIQPSNAFISSIVKERGGAVLLLGSRRAEGLARTKVLNNLVKKAQKGYYGTRDRVSPNAGLPGTLVYTPIENWSNDDVWVFLMQIVNPWGYNNKDLLTMYQGASPDGECPLVIDSSTPSCGDSRFGCWVCTLVDQDKSMTAMIQNDQEKEWMMPLLQLRNALDFRMMGSGEEDSSDRQLREFRKMAGGLMLFHDRLVHGPYTQQARENWLRKLLEAQIWIRRNGPADVRQLELISLGELQEIRRIWVTEKHEIEDILPGIYQEVTGEPYPGQRLNDNAVLGAEEMKLLRELCGDDELHFRLTRELLSVERQQLANARRAGLFEQLEKAIRSHYYENEDDALDMARRYAKAREQAGKGERGRAFEQPELEIEGSAEPVQI